MKTKYCPKCDTVKPVTAFTKHARTKDNLQPYCQSCQKKVCRDVCHVHNARQCRVKGYGYVKKSHPLWVEGGRFDSEYEWHMYWRENSDGTPVKTKASFDDTPAKEGFIYVIYNQAWEGWYKVGRTDNVASRLSNYQTVILIVLTRYVMRCTLKTVKMLRILFMIG